MDCRAWLSLMFVVSAVLPLTSFGFILRAAVKEHRRLARVKPGTFDDFDAAFDPETRAQSRKQLIVSPLRDTALVGGGVVVASVASILSLYVLD